MIYLTALRSTSATIPISALPNVDNLSNVVIYSFFSSHSNSPQSDNDDLKQIDADDLEEMNLKWQMAMLTIREAMTRAFRQMRNQPTMHSWHLPPQVLPVLIMRLLSYQQNETVFEENIKLLKLDVELRDKALVALRKNFEKVEKERDKLSLKLEKFQTSLKNLSQLLASQTNDKTRLGYNNQVFTSSMFDCDEMFNSETDESFPASPIYDRYQSGEGYHDVSPPYTRTFMLPKRDLVFHATPNVNETVHTAFNVELSPTKPDKDLSPTHRPSAPIIEDWVFDSEDDYEVELLQNSLSFIQPIDQVKTPRPSVQLVETSIPATNHKTTILKPKIHENNQNRKACFVCKSLTLLIKDCDYYKKQMVQKSIRNNALRGNTQHYARKTNPQTYRHSVPTEVLTKFRLVSLTAARPDKGVIDSGCLRHMTGNMSYLSDFEAINGGYVTFSGNLKGGKIIGIENQLSLKVKIIRSDNRIEFKNQDLNQFYGMKGIKREFSVARTPQQNGIVERKNRTFIEAARTMLANSLLPFHFGLRQLILLVMSIIRCPSYFNAKKPGEENVQKYVLFLLWSSGSKNPQNTDDDATFEAKEPEFEVEKPESEVHISLSSGDKTKKHDDKTKRDAKGKSPVELSTGVRKLIEEFEDFTDNSTNKVNAASTSISTVGQNSTNSTNTFSVVGPSNTAINLTHRESSYVDPFQYPDDPNMPSLEDITYFDDEENVGAEADFTNLETTITVSPIASTRVHRDHHVSQTIGDLSIGPLTRSMTRMVTDEGGRH
nr:putative ribonuclease H-like domain-containing protein [Tanacetum cinerariifolium]